MSQIDTAPDVPGSEIPLFEGFVSNGLVYAGFEGTVFRLALERRGGLFAGRFISDGPMWLRILPSGTAPVAVASRKPAPQDIARAALPEGAHERAPLPLTRRTVFMDECGEIERAEWCVLTPAQFTRVMTYPATPIVPSRERRIPLGRCDEYYDQDGRLCRTAWATRSTSQQRAA
ncbi:hypothetical protein [Fimbriiglobus ruber]|uniref:Uncharacterized protein n=1 Tax=Fimbriiglobus ruber TaxID=1908690 RepID=A0A225DAL2_9BACT|nr:hypothetical protein [Fimbriiglobus ruber]OWK36704.1 hypothetical protein FRUB_09267 [Fimbriiglobus ruber]